MKVRMCINKSVDCVINNRHIWLLLFPCIMIAIVKGTMSSWSNKYLLMHSVHRPEELSSAMLAITMALGFIITGYFSDKLFCGQRWKTNILFHAGVVFLLLFFWLMPTNIIVFLHLYIKYGIYFFCFGIQIMILIAALELSSQKIRGTVIGFIVVALNTISSFSYFPIAVTVDRFGWNYFFVALCGCVALSALAIWFCRSLYSVAKN